MKNYEQNHWLKSYVCQLMCIRLPHKHWTGTNVLHKGLDGRVLIDAEWIKNVRIANF